MNPLRTPLRFQLAAALLAIGCDEVRIVPGDPSPLGGGTNDGGASSGGAPSVGGSGGENAVGGGGFGGGCQTGFIQISGDADALLESVCTAGYGAKYTDRPVGYFYYSGPRANGELTVVGCAGPQQQFPLLGFSVPLTEPGTASATGTYYEASGLDWSSQQDSLTVTIDDFGKEGDTIDGSYEGTFFHDGSPMTVSGTFSVCHVASTGDV